MTTLTVCSYKEGHQVRDNMKTYWTSPQDRAGQGVTLRDISAGLLEENIVSHGVSNFVLITDGLVCAQQADH